MSGRLSIEYFFSGDPGLPFDLVRSFAGLGDLLGPRRRELLESYLDGRAIVAGQVEELADVRGPVHIGEGTVVHAGASITGPVYIGRNCSIRHGAQIRAGSVLGDECVVGHDAEIKNTVCMSGSKLQSGIFAGDSVLGTAARLGSGTILANRRFDQRAVTVGAGDDRAVTDLEFLGAVIGDSARLGANVVTAPGTAIGPYTWVSSLVSLHGFVPRAKLVMLRQDLDVRDKPEVGLRSGRGEYEIT